jgi:hypothetical protein
MLMIAVRAPLELVIRRLLTIEIGSISDKHYLVWSISEQLSCNDRLVLSENSISVNVLKTEIFRHKFSFECHSYLMDNSRNSLLALELEKTGKNTIAQTKVQLGEKHRQRDSNGTNTRVSHGRQLIQDIMEIVLHKKKRLSNERKKFQYLERGLLSFYMLPHRGLLDYQSQMT